jgi:hypothetical protein
MENEFMKRGYLLPEGCKDLMDVLKLKQPWPMSDNPQAARLRKAWEIATSPQPPIKGEIQIPRNTTVLDLAKLLGQDPSLFVLCLFMAGKPAKTKEALSFSIISEIARKYGYMAIESDE